MSFGRREEDGKDVVYFLSKEDLKESAADSSEEKQQEEAFDPKTGQINWDCPCLGGMAKGPCGEDFKSAFSCFVFSEAEPKGVDCVDMFKKMQSCFQEYPEYYADQLKEDDDDTQEEEKLEMVEEVVISSQHQHQQDTQAA